MALSVTAFNNRLPYLNGMRQRAIGETIGAKALQIFISIYPFHKSERLSVGTKLILYKALIRSILTYPCPA
jgi:hypothetical protein